MGYPSTMLVLSVAAYTAPRRVTVARAMSREVKPNRGIGAVSGLATFELKLLDVPIMDAVVSRYAFIV